MFQSPIFGVQIALLPYAEAIFATMLPYDYNRTLFYAIINALAFIPEGEVASLST